MINVCALLSLTRACRDALVAHDCVASKFRFDLPNTVDTAQLFRSSNEKYSGPRLFADVGDSRR